MHALDNITTLSTTTYCRGISSGGVNGVNDWRQRSENITDYRQNAKKTTDYRHGPTISSIYIYMSDLVKTWSLVFCLGPGAARLQASPMSTKVGGLTS